MAGKTIPHELPSKPQEIIGEDIFSIDKETLCIVDYYSKFPVMKRADELSAYHLIRAAKVAFTEFGLPKNSIICRHKHHFRLI